LALLLDLTWNWLHESGTGGARHQIVVLGDAHYPASLLTIEDPPLMLYLLGAGEFASNALLAVVGSRNQIAGATDDTGA
jgi:DNA processing protein